MENAHNLYLHLKQFVGFPSKWIWRSKDWLYQLTRRNTSIPQILEETPLQTFSTLRAPFLPLSGISTYNEVTQRARVRQQTGLVSHPLFLLSPWLHVCEVPCAVSTFRQFVWCDKMRMGTLDNSSIHFYCWIFAHGLMFLSPSGSNLAHCRSLPMRWTSILEEPVESGSLFSLCRHSHWHDHKGRSY